MAIERTLSIIKPDAVAKNVIGQIYARFEAAGLKVVAARMAHLSRLEAEQFYAVHKERPFFKDLVDFMISGPVMIQALEGLEMLISDGSNDPVIRMHNITDLLNVPDMPCTHFADEDLMRWFQVITDRPHNAHRRIEAFRRHHYIK